MSDPMRNIRLTIIGELRLAHNLARSILKDSGECEQSPLLKMIENHSNNLKQLDDLIRLNMLYEKIEEEKKKKEIQAKLEALGKTIRKVLST